MTDDTIEIYRAVYNKFDHVEGCRLSNGESEVVDLIRSGDSALGGETGFFFDTIEEYFLLCFEKKKDPSHHRDEEFFDLFFLEVDHAERFGLRDLVPWLKRRSMSSNEYQRLVKRGDDGYTWTFTPVPTEVDVDETMDDARPNDSTDGNRGAGTGDTAEGPGHATAGTGTTVGGADEAGDGTDGWSDEFFDAGGDADKGAGDATTEGGPGAAATGTDGDDTGGADNGRDGSDPSDHETEPYDDGAEILNEDEDNEDDEPVHDGGVSEKIRLVAELYDRYRRGETGSSGAIPATFAEVAMFTDTVDRALGHVSYVSTPRSTAGGFDFANGTRESTVAYEGLINYLQSLYEEDALRWERLPTYREEVEEFASSESEKLELEASAYEQSFEDARHRLAAILNEELETARARMEAATTGDLEPLEDDSGSVVSNLRRLRGDDEPSTSEQNVQQVHAELKGENIVLDEDRIEALAEHVAGRAAEKVADRIAEEVTSQLKSDLRETANDDFVELATESIRLGDRVVRTESYKRFTQNGDGSKR